jgi:hypothetical protein
MRHWVAAALLAACAFAAAPPGKKTFRTPQLEILELKTARDVDRVQINGRVRNASDVAGNEVQLVILFLSSDGKTVATRRGALEPEEFGPGEETAFLFETLAPARAVSLRLEATDRDGSPLRVTSAGPYPLE